MNRSKEKSHLWSAAGIVLIFSMAWGQAIAIINVPPGEIGYIEETSPGSGIWELKNNVTETIKIMASDLTLDGNKDDGYTVTSTGGGNGVEIVGLKNVVVKNMNITNFSRGIYVSNWGLTDLSGEHHLTGNTLDNNTSQGIGLMSSQKNTIESNSIVNNVNIAGFRCMFLNTQCSDNVIVKNTLNSNLECGIMLENNSDDNKIYNNNFINNSTQVTNNSSDNIFSMPSPIGGNYWDDWAALYDDDDGDGFLDKPRDDLTNGIDELPLAEEYSGPMIKPVIAFFDKCKEKTIIPSLDKGRPEDKRLDAFRDLLVKAQDLIESGDYDSACKKLDKALALCDPTVPPPDLIRDNPDVEGDDLGTLIDMINTLKGLLGCPET